MAFCFHKQFVMKQPIGMFDSGVGGLSVWREVAALLPNEDIVYFADNDNCPYGPKDAEEVILLSEKIVDFFLSKGVKLVVVACNTATAAAIDYLRGKYTIPFVGMEPAVKPAALNTQTGCVGILATAGTLGGKLFNTTKERYASGVEVVMQVGTGLVELVEHGEQYSEKAQMLLAKYVVPMVEQGCDHIVLGCTHYPFFRPLIDEIAGEGVTIVDPAPAVARRVKELLEEECTLASADHVASYQFYASGDVDTMKTLLAELLPEAAKNSSVEGHISL